MTATPAARCRLAQELADQRPGALQLGIIHHPHLRACRCRRYLAGGTLGVLAENANIHPGRAKQVGDQLSLRQI
jgi:hypothetical protein